jgi:hypothetical protein
MVASITSLIGKRKSLSGKEAGSQEIGLIFQNPAAAGDLPELAPVLSGCRGFTGPVPPPLWMSKNIGRIIPYLEKKGKFVKVKEKILMIVNASV